MYNSVFRELLTHMMEDPRNIGLGIHLLFGAKNLERIGDHATNIAETVYFLVHGKAINDQRPKGDVTSTTLVVMRGWLVDPPQVLILARTSAIDLTRERRG